MDPTPNPIAPLGREEYVEQAHVFGVLAERLRENVPAQEALGSLREEVLATTKLPLAIDFMLSELRHAGLMGAAMAKLPHYFTPLQAYLIEEAELETGRFDLRIGLELLQLEARYRAGDPAAGGVAPSRQGLFFFQFEAISRNRLKYNRGLEAIAGDPAYDDAWRAWLLGLRSQVGFVDMADLVYVHSEHCQQRQQRAGRGAEPPEASDDGPTDGPIDGPTGGEPPLVLFGEREGRIALANRRKDPMYLFASLHRQLGYPAPPRPPAATETEEMSLPQLARRLEQMEKRVTLVEEEQRGGIDLTKFYAKPDDPAAGGAG